MEKKTSSGKADATNNKAAKCASTSPDFGNAISCAVRQQNRQFGRRRDQQLQMVADSNHEIREHLSRAGFSCAAMHRGIGKRLICVRNAKGGRDE